MSRATTQCFDGKRILITGGTAMLPEISGGIPSELAAKQAGDGLDPWEYSSGAASPAFIEEELLV